MVLDTKTNTLKSMLVKIFVVILSKIDLNASFGCNLQREDEQPSLASLSRGVLPESSSSSMSIVPGFDGNLLPCLVKVKVIPFFFFLKFSILVDFFDINFIYCYCFTVLKILIVLFPHFHSSCARYMILQNLT